MVDPRMGALALPKTDKGYKRVQLYLAELRQDDLLPYEWIVDDSRFGHHPSVWNPPADMVQACARQYRVDPWRNAPRYGEVWAATKRWVLPSGSD